MSMTILILIIIIIRLIVEDLGAKTLEHSQDIEL